MAMQLKKAKQLMKDEVKAHKQQLDVLIASQ